MTVTRTERSLASRNERGSAEDRRRRREWLLATFRADYDLLAVWPDLSAPDRLAVGDVPDGHVRVIRGTGVAACRCFRCGVLLTITTLTVDRIRPGCQGGTYRRTNIRPACRDCNTDLGWALARERRNA